MAVLSPLMSTAGAGLLPDPPANIGVALSTANTFSQATANYVSISTVATFSNVVTQANALRGGIGNTAISNATFDSLIALSTTNFPPVNDVPPSGNFIANLIVPGLTVANVYLVTDAIDIDSSAIMGGGDLTRFCQVFQSAQGYVAQVNYTLESVAQSQILNNTFNPALGGMNTISTGGVNLVSNDLVKFGVDLSQLGFLINLGNLDDLGLPGELLAQIGRISGGSVPVITTFLQAQGIPDVQIADLAQGNNTLTSSQELKVYTAMRAVTGDVLAQTKLILNVTTANITNMAQLLDPRYIMPLSYKSLLCPTTTGLKNIYLTDGSVNTALTVVVDDPLLVEYTGINTENSYNELKKIIPADQALANKAFARALSQIKNISQTSLPALAVAVVQVETNNDLPLVANLTAPVPSGLSSFYSSDLGQGSGPNGELYLTDVIGIPVGFNLTDNFRTVTNALANLSAASTLDNLVECYENMQGVLNGSFGDGPVTIPSGLGQGIYTDYDNAFTGPGLPGVGLIPAAATEIANIVTQANAVVSTANQAWYNIVGNVKTQITNQTLAQIDYGNLSNGSRSDAMSFASNLHEYGVDNTPGGPGNIIVALANTATLSGQCMIGSLREGRNIKNLQEAGIRLDTQT